MKKSKGTHYAQKLFFQCRGAKDFLQRAALLRTIPEFIRLALKEQDSLSIFYYLIHDKIFELTYLGGAYL